MGGLTICPLEDLAPLRAWIQDRSSEKLNRHLSPGADPGGVDWVSSHPPMSYIVDAND